jgi:HSP20 family protein
MARLREEMDDLFSQFWGDGGDWSVGDLITSLDLSESENELQVRMDVPGVKPEDIDIELSGNMLTISGERKEEAEEEGRTFHRVERRTGRFSRTVMLPCDVDEGQIEARNEGGVLTIKLPKTETSKSRRIEVKS